MDTISLFFALRRHREPGRLHLPQPDTRERFDVTSILFRRSGIAAAAILLSACSWPGSFVSRPVEHPARALSVAPASAFLYMPARSGRVSANRIENTAMTGIVLKTTVNQAVRNAIAHQLKRAGFDLVSSRAELSGRIDSLSANDVRSPAEWTLKISYVIRDKTSQRVLYAAVKTTTQKFPKFTSPTIAVDDMLKESVAALMADESFNSVVAQ